MLRIVLTGPESTGKSTLAAELAEHYDLPYVKEFARYYLEAKLNALNDEKSSENSDLYDETDLFEMFLGQINAEAGAVRQSIAQQKKQLLICDTDVLTYQIWSEEVFKRLSPKLSNAIKKNIKTTDNQNVMSMYLLCSPEGIAWEYDPLRENPTDRDRLFLVYEKTLQLYKKNYKILRGSHEERLKRVITEIENFRQNKLH